MLTDSPDAIDSFGWKSPVEIEITGSMFEPPSHACDNRRI